MLSATALLFIAAQAGFLDGPRVLANMALDRWFPTRFATLSDRLVTQNGILLMGGAALLVMLATRGSVGLLVVLYSINVFITFSLSQLGMVRHWWKNRATAPQWKRKLAINGIGLCLTSFILISLCVVKFHEGGWVTLVVTGAVVALAFFVKRHYSARPRAISNGSSNSSRPSKLPAPQTQLARITQGRTAIVLRERFQRAGPAHVPRHSPAVPRNVRAFRLCASRCRGRRQFQRRGGVGAAQGADHRCRGTLR